MITKTKISLIFVGLLLITGCGNQMYRTQYNSCDYLKSGDCGTNSLQNVLPDSRNNYRLGFIEYDDQGQLWDRKQLDALVNTYSPIAANDDVLLILYIHGWQHNANGDPEDNNITHFRGLLSNLASIEAKTQNPRKVLGVYVGWRGKSIPVEGLNLITFWDRKNTASVVGQQGVTELLLRLEEIVNVKMGEDDKNHQTNSKLVTIGHSFGGAVLYTSLQQILVDRFIDSRHGKTYSSQADGFGDLVVLMNPALEALRFSTLYDISQAECRNYGALGGQLPKLAVLTSETDRATGWAFPAGRFFSTFFEAHNVLNRQNCVNHKSQPVELHEYAADLETIGHFEPFITHRLNPSTRHVDTMDMKNTGLQSLWLQQGRTLDLDDVELIHLGKTDPLNPYLNIEVSTDLISGHSDIWGDDIVEFIRDLIRVSTAVNN